MKLIAHQHDSFETVERRRQIALIVSKLMVGEDYCGKATSVFGDPYRYYVDRNRYWEVRFDKDDPTVLRILHYDNNQQAIFALALWLATNIRAQVELTMEEQEGELKPFVSSLVHFLNKERK